MPVFNSAVKGSSGYSGYCPEGLEGYSGYSGKRGKYFPSGDIVEYASVETLVTQFNTLLASLKNGRYMEEEPVE